MAKVFNNSWTVTVKNWINPVSFFLGVVITLGIGIWILSPVSFDIFSSWQIVIPDEKGVTTETRGQFGDSFGFATSLFSFLSFVGVLSVFVLQRQHTDARDKPFLMSAILPGTVPLQISRLAKDSEYQVTFLFGVNNYSEHLAHSCQFEYQIESEKDFFSLESSYRSRPIIRRDTDEKMEKKWTLQVSETLWFLNSLTSSIPIHFQIKLTYQNSAGVSYSVKNNYQLSLESDEHDAINELRACMRGEKAWAGDKIVSVVIEERHPFVVST